MSAKKLSLLIFVAVLLAIGVWLKLHPDVAPFDEESRWKYLSRAEHDASFGNIGTMAETAGHGSALSFESLKLHLIEHKGPWGISERAQILALDPSRILEILDDDEILAREDGRNMIREIYGVCGSVLAVASVAPTSDPKNTARIAAILDAPGAGWCKQLLESQSGTIAWGNIKKLLDLTQHATPAEVSHGERVYQNAADAMARDDGSLARLVLDEDALQVTAALDSMHQAHDTSVIEDWRLLDNLDEVQRTATWQALWSGLDCTWIGNCSEYSLPVSSLCGMPHFQCDAGSDYYTIMRRSLSPAQFEALMMLMNQVNAWRHQQGG